MNWKCNAACTTLVLLAACGGGGEEECKKVTVMAPAPLIETPDGRLVRMPGKFVPVEVCEE